MELAGIVSIVILVGVVSYSAHAELTPELTPEEVFKALTLRIDVILDGRRQYIEEIVKTALDLRLNDIEAKVARLESECRNRKKLEEKKNLDLSRDIIKQTVISRTMLSSDKQVLRNIIRNVSETLLRQNRTTK